MKSIFERPTIDALVARIQKLDNSNTRAWGIMSPYQMVKHCILSEEMYQGKKKYKRLFIGRLFGKMALKSVLKDAEPFKPNGPTHPTFKITGTGELEPQKNKWIELIKGYQHKQESDFAQFSHPFFGKMTKEQVGLYVYKHTDHHLRQFGL